jgi:hypothetical protein
MASAAGAVSVVAVILYGFLGGVVWQELVAQLVRYALDEAGVSYAHLREELLTEAGPAAARQFEQFADPPLGIGLAGAVALMVLLPFLGELLYVVAIRALAATRGRQTSFPTDAITGGLGIAFVRMVIADILLFVLVGLGLLLILPGIAFMILFLFVRQAIVLDDAGVIGSFKTSYGLARENLGGAIVVWLAGVTLTFGLLFFGALVPIPGLTTIGYAVVSIYTVSLTTVAYQQASGSRGATI